MAYSKAISLFPITWAGRMQAGGDFHYYTYITKTIQNLQMKYPVKKRKEKNKITVIKTIYCE